MMKRFSVMALFLCCLTNCSKDEVDQYGDITYVYLANDSAAIQAVSAIEYSFALHPRADKSTLPVLIKLVGKLSDTDRAVSISVDAAQTTALPEDYELPPAVMLRANRAVDTLAIVLHNSEKLKAQKVKIRLTVDENANFRLGPPGNRHIEVTFSDMIAKPDWWDIVVETNFLGQYSDTKYRLFIDATGIADMAKLTETEQRAYAIIFRDFLASGREKGEVYEDENGLVNVSPNLF